MEWGNVGAYPYRMCFTAACDTNQLVTQISNMCCFKSRIISFYKLAHTSETMGHEAEHTHTRLVVRAGPIKSHESEVQKQPAVKHSPGSML